MALPRLLVVEDDKNDLEQLLSALRDGDFEVSIATRGQDAKRMLNQSEFDSILVNLSLPDMDGLELVRWCQERWPSMPVQIVSGHYEMETKMKAFQAGACYFWQKPFEAIANLAIIKMLQIRRVAYEEGRASRSPKTTTWGVITSVGLAGVLGGYLATDKLKLISDNVGMVIQGVGALLAIIGPALHGSSAQDARSKR